MSIKEMTVQAVSSPKVAIAVSSVTAGTGIGTIYDVVPMVAGVIASLAAATLSVILSRYWILKMRIMLEEDKERKENARLRALKGEWVRRADD